LPITLSITRFGASASINFSAILLFTAAYRNRGFVGHIEQQRREAPAEIRRQSVRVGLFSHRPEYVQASID
jgi:hypothetical protein